MKSFIEQIDTGRDSSIKVKTYTQQWIDVPLHHHPEHEIVYIQKGEGKLFLADLEEHFISGDLFFIRGSIPHLFEDAAMRTGIKRQSKVTVVQYRQSLFESLYALPEFREVGRLERMIDYGIRLKSTPAMKKYLASLEKQNGLLQFNALIALLNEIVQNKTARYITSVKLPRVANSVAYLRLQKMHGFLGTYFSREVTVEEVASLLHLNKTSFCRFLKIETGKTFSEHLNSYRIQHACMLLRNSAESVQGICYDCGFNNAAYFFRQFKKLQGVAPLEYRRRAV